MARCQNYWQLKYGQFLRNDYLKWSQNCRHTEKLFLSAFADETTEDGTPLQYALLFLICNLFSKKFYCSLLNTCISSFNLPNHHIYALHYVPNILFNGHPQQTSTQPWEHFHQPVKAMAKQSNQHDLYADIIEAVCFIISCYFAF
jgi:hypothetical protein